MKIVNNTIVSAALWVGKWARQVSFVASIVLRPADQDKIDLERDLKSFKSHIINSILIRFLYIIRLKSHQI